VVEFDQANAVTNRYILAAGRPLPQVVPVGIGGAVALVGIMMFAATGGGSGGGNPRPNFPTKVSKVEHIFRNAPGHVDPPASQRGTFIERWIQIASDPANHVPRANAEARNIISPHAPSWFEAFVWLDSSGNQYWVIVDTNTNMIDNAGVNGILGGNAQR
jgi:hypothetical protein